MNLNLEYVAKIMTVAIMKRITYGVLQMVHMIGIIVFVSTATPPTTLFMGGKNYRVDQIRVVQI